MKKPQARRKETKPRRTPSASEQKIKNITTLLNNLKEPALRDIAANRGIKINEKDKKDRIIKKLMKDERTLKHFLRLEKAIHTKHPEKMHRTPEAKLGTRVLGLLPKGIFGRGRKKGPGPSIRGARVGAIMGVIIGLLRIPSQMLIEKSEQAPPTPPGAKFLFPFVDAGRFSLFGAIIGAAIGDGEDGDDGNKKKK